MAPPLKISKLLEHEQRVKDNLKQIRDDLKDAIAETPLYRTIYDATMQQGTDGCQVSEKIAAAHAHKVTLANFTKKEEEDV